MGGKSMLGDFHVNRLDFLRYSLATSVAVWAGTQVSGIDEAEAQDLFGRAALDPARFPQSVASGDPKPNGIVLWTRVSSGSRETLRVGYRIALDDGSDDDAAFADPVLSGVAETNRAKDYTLKVQLQNAALKPFRKYRYRFYFNGSFSRTGRFKTLPAPNQATDKVRFGYVSCQDYTNGYFNAYHHLAQEDIDFVVHLGDYTYETVASESFQGGGPEERNDFKFPDGGDEELTLRDYRFTYKLYKQDQNLQRAHENFAFIMIWDDHEFANDAYQIYAPDEGGTQEQPNRNPRRREAASRAWFEYNPVGVYYNPDRDPLNEIVLFRSFAFGDLMELVMTDQRLYRDAPPNGNEQLNRYLTPGTGREGEEAPDRTMLGDGTPSLDGFRRPPQLEYFVQKITRSPRTWKVWGNEVTFMQLKIANTDAESATVDPIQSLDQLFPQLGEFRQENGLPPAPDNPEGVYTTLDQWDGFQAERRRITQRFRDDATFPGTPGVENFVTITGDIHSYLAGYIKENYDDRTCQLDNRPVGVELVCGSITSANLSEIATFGFGSAPQPDVGQFTAQVNANNPHIKYFNSNEHGYNIVEVTKDSILCSMKAVRVKPTEVDQQNRNQGIREEEAQNTEMTELRRFRVPAQGTTFAGVPITEPLIFDETTGAPLPLTCEAAVSPGPGGAQTPTSDGV